MRSRSAAFLVAILLVAACGGDDKTAETVHTLAIAPVVATTTSTIPRTTTTETTTTTTIAATTTTEALPIPLAAPEPRANEPENQLGSLEIPKLGVTKPLFEGVSLTTLDRGPGHWPGTAMPGHIGNVVIGGHRTSKDRPFRHIDQLVPGDEVILTTLEGRFVYRVNRTEIVTPDAVWVVDQTRAYTATLFACHPVGSTKERIVVFLDLVQP